MAIFRVDSPDRDHGRYRHHERAMYGCALFLEKKKARMTVLKEDGDF